MAALDAAIHENTAPSGQTSDKKHNLSATEIIAAGRLDGRHKAGQTT
jgi:hypothetical protein